MINKTHDVRVTIFFLNEQNFDELASLLYVTEMSLLVDKFLALHAGHTNQPK